MKIVAKDIGRDRSGTVDMIAEQPDDLWLAYNLVAKGDVITSATVRKVARQGTKPAQKLQVELQIKVEAVEYEKSMVRARGKNMLHNEVVKQGQFHTLQIELHHPFALRKKVWDSVALDLLRQGSETKASEDLAVVLMHEGLANIYLVGRSMVTNPARIESAKPRMRGRSKVAVSKFVDDVVQAFIRHVDLKTVRCAVIASPGETKDQVYNHLLLEAERRQLRPVIENKRQIVRVHANSGDKQSLKGVPENANVVSMIKDTNAAKEVKALEDFNVMLERDPARTCYGPKEVQLAQELGAIQTLLVTDELFRSGDVATRKKYVELVDSVKLNGGAAHVFSSLHVSGERLAMLSGVAAILSYPLPDLDDMIEV